MINAESLKLKFINIKNLIRKRKHRIHQTNETYILKVSDGSDSLFICRRKRHNRSKNGIKAGINALAEQYHLNLIDWKPKSIFIDCGANIGELGKWANYNSISYIAFEPEALEARCVDLNAFGGLNQTNRMGLWNEDTTLTFFRKPDSADSSFIQTSDYIEEISVPVRRLDGMPLALSSFETKVLKVEAEGAEPEVLQGAEKIIEMFDYVTIDCGFERGISKSSTFNETNTFLADHGFRVEASNLKRMTILYKNKHRKLAQDST